MPRPALWTAIRDALADEIGGGQFGPGDKLPTEAQLAGRFGVNRHTIRRAVADLQKNGLVHSRRGSGVVVRHRPTDYPIGKRVRFHKNLTIAGHIPGKRVLMLITRSADDTEAQALNLQPGAPVHVYEGLSFSDNHPIALVRSVFPADRFPNMLNELRRSPSITAGFAAHGVADYIRASTRINAITATPTQAMQLHLPSGTPILRTIGINVDTEGKPIEYGRTWFAGDKVTLTMAAEPSEP